MEISDHARPRDQTSCCRWILQKTVHSHSQPSVPKRSSAVNKDDTVSPRTQQRENKSWVAATKLTNSVITWKILRTHTWNDAVLSKVIEQVGKGFPDSCHDVHPDVKPYHVYRHQLSILDGVLCYKERVVIPEALRQECYKLYILLIKVRLVCLTGLSKQYFGQECQ